MKKKYALDFPPNESNQPVTYLLIKEYDIRVNILKAEIDAGKEGKMVVEFEADEKTIAEALNRLKNLNIKVTPAGNKLHYAAEKCVHCGACTGVCNFDALALDDETAELVFCAEKCVACGMCVKACPIDCFEISVE